MFVIVGLGNPGTKYEGTNHNMGFAVIDELARKHGVSVEKKKCKALVGECVIEGQKCVLCKPQTYMNLSGDSVVELCSWYKPEYDQLIVCYDDCDLPLGKLRFRPEGSAGTHTGMRDIVAKTGRTDFPRIRVGIGKPPEFMELMNYVLARVSGEDKEAIDAAIRKAAEAVEVYVSKGVEPTRQFIGR